MYIFIIAIDIVGHIIFFQCGLYCIQRFLSTEHLNALNESYLPMTSMILNQLRYIYNIPITYRYSLLKVEDISSQKMNPANMIHVYLKPQK